MEEKINETVITIRIKNYGTPVKSGRPFYENINTTREIEVSGVPVYSDRMTEELYQNASDPISNLEKFLLDRNNPLATKDDLTRLKQTIAQCLIDVVKGFEPFMSDAEGTTNRK